MKELSFPDLMSMINWYYCIVSVLVVYSILKWVFKTTKTFVKIAIHVLVGVTLGIVWRFYINPEATNETLLLSFVVQVVFYAWFLKPIMKFFSNDYDDGKGVI